MIVAILVIHCFMLMFLMATYGAVNKLSNMFEYFLKNVVRVDVRQQNPTWPDRENL